MTEPSAHDKGVVVLGRTLPGVMTRRARAYMLIVSLRHLLLGVACVVVPHGFQSQSYDGIKSLLPLPPDYAIAGWGVLFLATGLFAGAAAWIGREGEARWALLASVLSSAMWAAGFTVYVATFWWDQGELINPSGPIIWTAVTCKDITMLRSPLKNPFEELERRAVIEVGAEADEV